MNSLSNYLHRINLDFYGGNQEDYLQASERTIDVGVGMIRAAVGSKKDLIALFFDVMNFFQKERREIARRHDTCDASLFGTSRMREGLGGYFASVPLDFNYLEYRTLFKEWLQKILSEMKDDSNPFFRKKCSKEEVVLGRRVRFDVEILHVSEIRKRIGSYSEDNLRKILKVENTYKEILGSPDLLRKLKQIAPIEYQNTSLAIFLSDFFYRFGVDSTQDFLLGTLRVEIGGKSYAMSRYFSSVDLSRGGNPVAMLEWSKILVIHQDTFLIDDTLKEISKIFAKALSWTPQEGPKELKDRVALFRFMYSHCTPCVRGDGAIGDWLELAIYRYHGFSKVHFNQECLPPLEAVACPSLSKYLERYDQITKIDPVS